MINSSHTIAISSVLLALQHAAKCRHRAVLVVAGEREWGLQQAAILFATTSQCVWLGDASTVQDAIPASKAKQVLGSEYALAVMDAWSGLHPDALAAVGGTLMAGGALVLVTPPLDSWHTVPDPDYARLATYPYDAQHLPQRFLQYVSQELANAAGVLILNQQDGVELKGFAYANWPAVSSVSVNSAANSDQQTVLNALLTSNNTAVLLAQRGRGKSAVLGFVANALHAEGKQLLLTAPSRAAAQSVFRHANYAVPFLAPDGILADVAITADVLLVDEAAAISLPILLGLLQRFPQVIFATTTEGYEGTGQGFVLRFLRELNAMSPAWQQHTLAVPIRWADNDPLEQLLYRLFLLDAEPASLANNTANNTAATTRVISVTQQTVFEQPSLLREVYGLLRSAHYRTTPDDLRFLLDAPGVSLFIMQTNQQLVGVALLVREGELDDAMANAITAGERRPRGHLLVQTLAVQEAQPQYLQQRVSRVVRIAIHPSLQGQGYGSHLLQVVVEQQREQGVNVIGSSFSATPEVLAFWQKNGFTLARIGHRRQTASAAPSAVVLRVLH